MRPRWRDAVANRTVARDEDGMRLDRWFKTHYAPLPHSRPWRSCCAPARCGWMAAAPKRARGSRPARACACRRCATCRRHPRRSGAIKGQPRLSRPITLYEDDDLLVLNKPVGAGGAGRHQDRAACRPAARGDGRRARDAAASGAPARPRHLGRARHRQAAIGGGEARPRLPDPLGAQDLLGAGEGRAEAAARQGRSGASEGRGT